MRTTRSLLLFCTGAVTAAWAWGVWWVLARRTHEGPVVYVISERHGWGIHRSDPIGVMVPLMVTAVALAVFNHFRRPGAAR